VYTTDILVNLDEYNTYPRSLKVSPDSRKLAVAAHDGEKGFVVVNGEEGPRYEYIAEAGISFSLDSRSLAYVAGNAEGMFVVLDGKKLKAYQSIKDAPPVFSPDGTRLAFAATEAGREFVVEYRPEVQGGPDVIAAARKFKGYSTTSTGDYIEGKRYDTVDAGTVRYSPDGSMLVFTVRAGGKCLLVAGNTEGRAYDEIVPPVFGPDGRKFVYFARSGGLWRVVSDGKEGREYRYIIRDSLSLLADGTPVYAASTKGGYVLVTGDTEGPPEIDIKGVTVHRKTGMIAYSIKTGGKWRVIAGGKGQEAYDQVGGHIIFSPDGGNVAYAARRGSDWFMVEDGVETGPYEMVAERSIIFSQDGARTAFIARVGEGMYAPVLDGRTLEPSESVPGELVFSPDGAHLASIGVKGRKQYVAVDGESVVTFDQIVVCCGSRVLFDGGSGLHYIAVNHKKIFLVEEFMD